MQKQPLAAVHDDDLVDFMEGLEIYDLFLRREVKCAFCKDTITWDNLHSFFPDSGAVKCSCTKPDCIEKLLARLVERQA
jgi:hypothetical protein